MTKRNLVSDIRYASTTGGEKHRGNYSSALALDRIQINNPYYYSFKWACRQMLWQMELKVSSFSLVRDLGEQDFSWSLK